MLPDVSFPIKAFDQSHFSHRWLPGRVKAKDVCLEAFTIPSAGPPPQNKPAASTGPPGRCTATPPYSGPLIGWSECESSGINNIDSADL